LLGYGTQHIRLTQLLAALMPFPQYGLVETAKRLFALTPCRFSGPESAQRHRVARILPILAAQGLFPDLPGVPILMIYLVQREEAPMDIQFTGQRLINSVEPLRGPVDIRSHIVKVDLKLDHVFNSFLAIHSLRRLV
jgi:hypothetical protein